MVTVGEAVVCEQVSQANPVDGLHEYAVAPVAVKLWLPPEVIVALVGFTVIVGNASTVMVLVVLHPLLSVYVIALVPADAADITPVLEMVATEVVAEVHGLLLFAVPLPVNVNVEPLHKEVPPEIVGVALTVTVNVLLYAELLPSDTSRRYWVVWVKPLGTS